MQKNMVTTQYLGDLVVYNPVQWQQGIKQSHQNFHQLESPSSIASTGYQHPIPRDGARLPCHDRHQISRKVDAYYNTSAHISAQHSSYCGTSAIENSARQFVHHSGRPTDCSKRKKVNTNIDTGLQLRRNLNCAHSGGTSSAALQRGILGYAAQTIPLQDQHSPTHQSHPLLLGLRKGSTQDFKTAPSSFSEEIDVNIELCTGIFSDRSHCKGQEQQSSPAALNCGKTMTQIMDLSVETDSTTPCQRRLFSTPLSSQPARDELMPAGEMDPPTDDQIKTLITNYLTDFRENLKVNRHSPTHPNKGDSFLINGRDSTLHSDNMTKPDSAAHRPTTSYKEDGKKQSLNHDVIEQRSAKVEQALEEDSPKGTKAYAEITPTFKETGDCAFASEKYSKATLAYVGNSKHAPETKSFERRVSVNFNLTVKTHQSVTGDHTLVYPGDSEDETCLSGNWNLQNGRLTTLYYSLTPLKERIASHESIDTVAHMDNFPTVMVQQYGNGDIDNINLFISTESRPLTEKVAATCTKKEDKSPVVLSSEMNVGQTESPSTSMHRRKSVEDQQHCGATCKEGFVHTRPISKLQIHNLESDTTNQSEQPSNKTSHEGAMEDVGSVYTNTDVSIALSEGKLREQSRQCEDGTLSCLKIEGSQYEDISDDEDVSQLEREVPNTEHEKLRFSLVDYEDISEDENRQIGNMAVGEDEADDQLDDGLIVIPISMSDIRFEPEEDALSDAGTGDEDKRCYTSLSYCELPASASSPLEVFETVESFKRANGLQFINGFDLASPSRTAEDGLQRDRTPQRGDLKSEPEDSCDTEDSSDYSPARERFYLSSQLLKTGTLDSVSEKLSQDDVPILQEGQTSFDNFGLQELGQSDETKAASNHVQHKLSETADVILIDSDTEDESDQNCSNKAETTRLSSSGLDGGREDSHCERNRRSAETVDSQCGTGRDKFKNKGLQDPVIVLLSDSEDDDDQSYQKENRVRLSSSGSDDHGDAACVIQEMHSFEIMNSKHGTAEEQPIVSRLSCGESSFPQHQSKLHNPQFKEVMWAGSNDLSHSLKGAGQLRGAEGSSEHAQQKTSKQTSEERKKKTKRTLFTGLGADRKDSDDALLPPKTRRSPETVDRRYADKKINKPSLSSQDSSKTRPRSADKEADSTRRHVVQNSPTKEHLKLSRDSRVSTHGKDETRAPKNPTQTSKKSDSCETNSQHPHKLRFAPIPAPASKDSRHDSPRNKDAANRVSLPNQVSRSTASSRSSLTSGQLSEANRRSVSFKGSSHSGESSTSLPESKKNAAIPRHSSSSSSTSSSTSSSSSTSTSSPSSSSTSSPSSSSTSSSSRQMSHSSRSCSKLDHRKTPSEGSSSSASAQSSRAQVLKSWQNSYYPTRRDRRSNTEVGEDRRTTDYNLRREERPRLRRRHRSPVMRRQSSHESETPLMKRTKIDAVQWTRAINRDPPRKERHSVGEGYKWSETPNRFKPTRDYRR